MPLCSAPGGRLHVAAAALLLAATAALAVTALDAQPTPTPAASVDASDQAAACEPVARPAVFLASESGDSAWFALAIQARRDGRRLPAVLLLSDDAAPNSAQGLEELVRNAAQVTGYAIALNASQVRCSALRTPRRYHPASTCQAALTAHLP